MIYTGNRGEFKWYKSKKGENSTLFSILTLQESKLWLMTLFTHRYNSSTSYWDWELISFSSSIEHTPMASELYSNSRTFSLRITDTDKHELCRVVERRTVTATRGRYQISSRHTSNAPPRHVCHVRKLRDYHIPRLAMCRRCVCGAETNIILCLST